ncbi:DUF4405 domain-containing protein [Shewanella sp. A32]|uniref:DUF4405 domain-containing protein n=1 Tax=Shewanella sp. A32 TaxID=3031327 RepID=UPI0023B8FB06|nr:DUF4405 domain-containing protein [Shewanella sp. A32]MDF0534048.1 DUF4405 domain-containing protein [Shewanella sp. A32]
MFKMGIRHWSTPLVIGVSMVVGSSGILLFFHLSEGLIKSMHEWLGLLFVVAMLLHVMNHWSPFKRYFNQKLSNTIVAAVVVIACSFIVSAGTGGAKGNPAKRMLAVVQQAPLTAVAMLEQQPVEQLIAKLTAEGVKVDSPSQNLEQLAKSNNMHPFALLDIVNNNTISTDNHQD